MKKYFLFLVIIFSFLFPSVYINAETGFVPGQIWYSPEVVGEGETVKIHTVVWNGDKDSISAKVEFYDKNVILGTRDIVVLPEQLKEVNITWKVTAGDHTISAKIISSSITTNGRKEKITLDNVKTEDNKVFVPVTIKKIDGESATSSDVLKNELDKAGAKIGDVVPESVSVPVTNTIDNVDVFRENTLKKVDEIKDETKERIKILDQNINANNENDATSSTEKPIAYIKLFLISVLSLIFANKIVFYGLAIIIIFFILRAIYSKIRNR